MSFADDIRTIAKTKEIEEKLAKVVRDAAALSKASILASRTQATQTGNNSKSIASGPTGGGASIPVITLLGTSSVPPVGTPPPANNQTNSSTSTDRLTTSDASKAIDRVNGSQQTDMTSNAVDGHNPGGSDAGTLAREGQDDTGYTTLSAALDANGTLTAGEKTAVLDKYLADNIPHNGTQTASQVADGTGAVGAGGGSDPQLNGGTSLGVDRLTSIVGFDKDGTVSDVSGEVLVARLMLTGSSFPTPSTTDSTAQGQGAWVDADTPPVESTYTAGSVWKIEYGLIPYYSQTFSGLVSLVASSIGLPYAYGYTIATGIITASPEVGLGLLFSGNPNGVPGVTTIGSLGGQTYTYQTNGLGSYGLVVCGGAHATEPSAITQCALSAPVEEFWPKTGVYVLSYALGLLTKSIFDSEVPLSHTVDSSAIRLALGDGTNVVDGRFIDVELGSRGGYLVSTIDTDGTTVLSGKYYSSQGVLLITGIPPADIPSYRPK